MCTGTNVKVKLIRKFLNLIIDYFFYGNSFRYHWITQVAACCYFLALIYGLKILNWCQKIFYPKNYAQRILFTQSTFFKQSNKNVELLCHIHIQHSSQQVSLLFWVPTKRAARANHRNSLNFYFFVKNINNLCGHFRFICVGSINFFLLYCFCGLK